MILLLSSTHRADERRVARLEAVSLAEAGLEVVHVCVAGGTPPPRVATLALRRAPGALWRLLFLMRIGLVAARQRPGVVQANEPDLWAIALLLKAFLRCRVVFDTHEDYLDVRRLAAVPRPLRRLAARALELIFRAFARVSDGILGISAERAAVFPLPRRAPPVVIVRNTVRRAETLALPQADAAALVADIGCGVAVDAERKGSLAETMTDLFFRPLHRLVMGELARRACLGALAWEEDAAVLVALHRALADSPGAMG